MNSNNQHFSLSLSNRLLTIVLIAFYYVVMLGCSTGNGASTLHYEVVSDTLPQTITQRQKEKNRWKEKYEQCMQRPLFSNAIYLGLENNIHIGSINNLKDTNVNKRLSLFDTSLHNDIRHYFTLVDQISCSSQIELTPEMRNEFYSELVTTLKKSTRYGYLTDHLDSTLINFKISTIADNALLPDSLASLLQRTRDTSLLEFKRLLVTPGNALLVRTAMILGFYTEFPLAADLTPKDRKALSEEVHFKAGNGEYDGSIRLLPSDRVQVFINKYYTVFGQFYQFSELIK